jgi:hypothetical protein
MSAGAALAPDAAMALGIASTSMPFARTPADESERWLRVLRMHGEAGIALQALGVSEGPLPGCGGSSDRATAAAATAPASERAGSAPGRETLSPERDVVTQVTEQAAEHARRRGAGGVGTTDLLIAVMRIYGEDFDRVLRAHGTDRDEVLARLDAGQGPSR